MKRLALAIALIVVAAFPASASAAVNQWGGFSCTQAWNAQQNPVPFVCFTESAQLGGDKLTLSGSSDIANLANQPHSLDNLCSPKIWPSDDTWDNCISGVWAVLGSDDSVCMFRYANYGTRLLRFYTPVGHANTLWTIGNLADVGDNDLYSAIQLQQSGGPCDETFPA